MTSTRAPSQSCVERVVADGMCIGCGACAAMVEPGAITMELAANGFIEPRVHDREAVASIEDDFDRVCPGRTVIGPATRESLIWGPVASIAAGHAIDAETRHVASSGGALTALCGHLLDSGRVDVVVAMANDADDPLHPRPRLARSRAELVDTAGSRYCPSSPVAALSEVEPDERVAFVGKPCDVAAVRQMMKLDASLRGRVTYLLSFFCAGIPSFAGTEELIEQLGTTPSEVVDLRYRGNGWPGRATVTTAEGRASMSYHESWGGVLTRHRHPRCKICPDATGESADVACGDAWHDDGVGPIFDEAPGRSVIISRTPRGAELFDEAIAHGIVATEPFALDRLECIQQYQRDRKESIVPRVLATRLLGTRTPRYRSLGLIGAAQRNGMRRFAAQFRGAASRARRDHPRAWHRHLGRITGRS